MTDKTEAQQRVQTYIDRRKQSRGLDKDHIHGFDAGESSEATLLTSDLEALLGEIQQLKAQLSARQAAPDGWRLVPAEPDSNMKRAAQKALMDHSPHSEWLEEEWPDGLRMWNGMLSAAPPPPEREPHPPTRHCMCADCAPSFKDDRSHALTDEQIEEAYKDLLARRKKSQDEAFQAGIGKNCSNCSDGHYQADWNGYSTFHRCDKCRHVPFDTSGVSPALKQKADE